MNKAKKQIVLPRRIRVGSRQYTIDVVETMLNKGDMARVFYDKRQIQIATKSARTGRRYARKELNDSFWHELVHAILYDMDEHTLNRNERFVTEFAKRLADAVDSARFE